MSREDEDHLAAVVVLVVAVGAVAYLHAGRSRARVLKSRRPRSTEARAGSHRDRVGQGRSRHLCGCLPANPACWTPSRQRRGNRHGRPEDRADGHRSPRAAGSPGQGGALPRPRRSWPTPERQAEASADCDRSQGERHRSQEGRRPPPRRSAAPRRTGAEQRPERRGPGRNDCREGLLRQRERCVQGYPSDDAAKRCWPRRRTGLRRVLAGKGERGQARVDRAVGREAQANAAVDQHTQRRSRASAVQQAQERAARASGRRPSRHRAGADALALASRALDDATLVAPIDGVVIFNSAPRLLRAGRQATEGSAVSPRRGPFHRGRLSGLNFTAEVDEADIDRVKVGMKANVTLDAFPGEEFKSTVTRLNPVAQATATGGTVFAVEIASTTPARTS